MGRKEQRDMKNKVLLAGTVSFLLLSSLIGGLTFFFLNKNNSDSPCLAYPFTVLPVDFTRIQSIIPLGNLNPPGHTFPTDHMYFYVNSSFSDGFEIYAPGNITVTSISKILYLPPQDNISEDFSLEFNVCSHLSGRFGHINNLSRAILEVIGGFGEEYGDTVYEWEVAGRLYIGYFKKLELTLQAGTLIGRAGYMGGYDFWLKDDRVNLDWVNNEWTEEFQHTVCPLAYFTEDLQMQMKTKLRDWGGTPVEPVGYCGRIAFDVPNTAQGIWVRDGWENRPEDHGLALVYYNINASMGAISIGYALNSTWDSRVYLFSPKNSGFMNRNFSHITNDGNIYYYYCKGFEYSTSYDKVILLKMDGSRGLYLQFIDHCGSLLPNDPTILYNETSAIHYSR
ncbi:MAG: hypothetical protein K9W42_12455 [Candidatus Heimdallarchaeota archaeon]|nr:hypothetical protein [Candidatus Heimdallarchaeota archaeon]